MNRNSVYNIRGKEVEHENVEKDVIYFLQMALVYCISVSSLFIIDILIRHLSATTF